MGPFFCTACPQNLSSCAAKAVFGVLLGKHDQRPGQQGFASLNWRRNPRSGTTAATRSSEGKSRAVKESSSVASLHLLCLLISA